MIRFREARAEDDGELTRLVAKPMPGDLSLSMAREPSMLASCANYGPPRRVLVAEDRGELMAVCTHFSWRYRVGSQVREISTAADFRAERSAATSSVTGLGWRALRKRLEGAPALISLVEDNPISFKLFSKARKGWPELHKVASLKTLMLPLSPLSSVRTSLGLLQPGKEHVRSLLNADERHLSPVFETDDIGRVTPAADGFLAFHDGVKLAACGALWDPSDCRQIRIAGYSGLYGKLKSWCPALLPERGSEVRVRFAAFLKGSCRYAREQVLRGLLARARNQGAQFLVWGGEVTEPPPFPRYWPHFRMNSSLYQLCWTEQERLPRAGCGYEVAWL